MNDNFKCIYKILKALEAAMDYEDYDFSCISHEALGISEQRWIYYMAMLSDCGYVDWVYTAKSIDGKRYVDISRANITLKGLEYLSENRIMQRIYQAAKGVKTLVD